MKKSNSVLKIISNTLSKIIKTLSELSPFTIDRKKRCGVARHQSFSVESPSCLNPDSGFPKAYARYLTSTLAVFILFISACNKEMVSDTDPESPEPPAPTPEVTEPVPPDGILETMTWNIEWYGSTSNGPPDEDLQANNVISVLDSLKADLYAFQEISTQDDLDEITGRMMGYEGFVADYIPYDQRTAFVYNTQTIDLLSSGPIEEFQDSFDWAERFPLHLRFNYRRSANDPDPLEIYAIVIHAKAFPDQESYQRRKRAAQSLYDYLSRMKPDAHIVFLGDYNDDVDVSIYDESETPYQPFVEDTDEFFVITESLSESGQSSTVTRDDMIDHITVSNEMQSLYIPESVLALEPASFVDNYGTTTSDHYPIMAKFDIGQ
jgi:endonuclease/exonuclease/phosphatase family metal-dependent hydrolase